VSVRGPASYSFSKGNADAATGVVHRDSIVGRFVADEVSGLSPDAGDVRHTIDASSARMFAHADKTRFNVRSRKASSLCAPSTVLPGAS